MILDILKQIAEDLELSFDFGAEWLLSNNAIDVEFPLIAMLPITEVSNDENLLKYQLSFFVLNNISADEYNSVEMQFALIKSMRSKAIEYIRLLRDYEEDNVRLFNITNRSIDFIINNRIFDNYVNGVFCKIDIEMTNTESVC